MLNIDWLIGAGDQERNSHIAYVCVILFGHGGNITSQLNSTCELIKCQKMAFTSFSGVNRRGVKRKCLSKPYVNHRVKIKFETVHCQFQ